MCTVRRLNVDVLICCGALVASTQAIGATTCMVVGDKVARVASQEGEKSPPFLTNACESLRLLSGKALVSWVARDGKPNFASVGVNGPDRLPTPGAEERSGKVVWGELSTKREATRPAFMRALDEARPARVYIPLTGLELPHKPGAHLRVAQLDGPQPKTILESTSDKPVRLSREALQPGGRYVLEWSQNNQLEHWQWLLVGEAENKQLDEQHALVMAADLDAPQRRVVEAMFYEQLRLKINMGFALASQP